MQKFKGRKNCVLVKIFLQDKIIKKFEVIEMKIFENAMLGNLNLKNRLIRSATWENLAKNDGSIDEKTYKIY